MREAAVIDVGSNSVRLVVYKIQGRALTPFFNEKAMAGLGRHLSATRRLNPDGIAIALRSLKRFKVLLDGLGIAQIGAVGTAAVRDAVDGPDFIARVKEEIGISINVVPGVEEARLSALGVIAGAPPQATGVVGDLGGSSLELNLIENGAYGEGETFRLGPLALMDESGFDPDRVRETVDAALARSEVLKRAAWRGNFYAVGGAWRALARIDMSKSQHPLRVLHLHEMSQAQVLDLSDVVRRQSRRSLERMEEAAAKRADTLPYAAVVLERILRFRDLQRVVISAYGLREGLIFDSLPSEERRQDPLVASAEAYCEDLPRARAFGRALEAWVAEVFEAQSRPSFGWDRDRTLRAAAARLADMAANHHPDQRSENIFHSVLRAPFAGVTHAERAFLAAVLHHRYTRSAPDGQPAYDRLLDETQRRCSSALGAAFRLAADLSARAESVLRTFRLRPTAGAIELVAPSPADQLLTDQIKKRLDALAEALGVEARIVAR